VLFSLMVSISLCNNLLMCAVSRLQLIAILIKKESVCRQERDNRARRQRRL